MSARLTLLTIGVYGSTADSFFGALSAHNVTDFCDVRARRGVRGADYVYAKSTRLQAHIAQLGIRYHHFPALAPSQALRSAEAAVDKAGRVKRRDRSGLSAGFVSGYHADVLAPLDVAAFLAQFAPDSRLCFFCVEAEPEACHRRLLVEHLASAAELPVVHIDAQAQLL